MVNITSEVCSEVYDIIYNMKLYNKIPKGFIEIINKNRNPQYKVNIDYSKSINEQELQRGTRVVLALIYRDYLCSEEERKALIKRDKEELKQKEIEQREMYNPDNLFKSRIEKKEEPSMQNETSMVVYKETIFQKIINIFKKIFRIK